MRAFAGYAASVVRTATRMGRAPTPLSPRKLRADWTFSSRLSCAASCASWPLRKSARHSRCTRPSKRRTKRAERLALPERRETSAPRRQPWVTLKQVEV